MANTFIQIGSTVTVGSGGASSIDFTSIPSTYTDLLLKVCGRDGSISGTFELRPNNATTNRTTKELYGTGAAAGSQSQTAFYFDMEPSNYTASTFGSADIYIPNYAGSTNKSFSVDATSENNATTSYMRMAAWLWSSTAAITSLYLYPSSGSIQQYSTASLYGILKS
jgi:hypothetical protein